LKYRNRIEYFINYRDLNVYCAKKRKIVGEAATLPNLVRGSPCHWF
jgi:hypothetical protein